MLNIPEEESYINRNFQIGNYASNLLASNDPNILSRLRNQLVKGYRINKILPKLIVVILEDDVIQAIGHKHSRAKCTATPKYKKEVNWLLREFHRSIAVMKEYLPIRAKKNRSMWT